MATIQCFEDLVVWQKARELSREIYRVSNQNGFARDYDLKSQIRRSSGSVMDNIAEGFERGGKGEFIQFLGIAKGSAGEVRSQFSRAFDQEFISQSTFDFLYGKADEIGRMISRLIAYLNRSTWMGNKYHVSEELPEYNFERQTSNSKPN